MAITTAPMPAIRVMGQGPGLFSGFMLFSTVDATPLTASGAPASGSGGGGTASYALFYMYRNGQGK